MPKPAAGDTVFDLRDKSLMPGMVEGHFHAGYLNVCSMTDSGSVSALVHNKHVVNLGVELIGRSHMQVHTGIHDALAHEAPEAVEFSQRLREKGVRAAAAKRDAKFEES